MGFLCKNANIIYIHICSYMYKVILEKYKKQWAVITLFGEVLEAEWRWLNFHRIFSVTYVWAMYKCYYSKSSMSSLLFVRDKTIFEVLGNNCPSRFILTNEWLPTLCIGRQDNGLRAEIEETPAELLDSKVQAAVVLDTF